MSRDTRGKSDKQAPEKIFKKPKVLRLLLLILSVIVFFTLYEVCVAYNIGIIVHIYGILLALLLLAYGVLNRGFSRHIPESDELPPEMSDQEKEEYISTQKKRNKTAKALLIPIISILLTFAFDLIYILFT